MEEIREKKRIRKDQLLDQKVDNNPLASKIQEKIVSPSLRITNKKYDGTTNPSDHIACFQTILDLYGSTDTAKYRIFSVTLKGMVRAWFDSLLSHSVTSFKQLSKLFVGHFLAKKGKPKPWHISGLWCSVLVNL